MAAINAELWVTDVGAALDYYENVLGFKRVRANAGEDGRVRHCEVQFGTSNSLVITSATPGPNAVAEVLEPLDQGSIRGAGVMILIVLSEGEDLDGYYEEVARKDIKLIQPIYTRPSGLRLFQIQDPNGYVLSFEKRVS